MLTLLQEVLARKRVLADSVVACRQRVSHVHSSVRSKGPGVAMLKELHSSLFVMILQFRVMIYRNSINVKSEVS